MKLKVSTLNMAQPPYFVAAGVVLGLLIVITLFKKLYCFYAYQPGSAIITAGLGLLGGIAGLVAKFVRDKEKISFRYVQKYFLLACGLFITIAVLIFCSPFFLQLDKNSCVERFDDLVRLIKLEEQAVLTKDLDIIKNIYTPNAIITDVENKRSDQAYTYYSRNFAELEYCIVTHSHFETVEFSSNEVVLTTSSQGTWGQIEKGCIEAFSNSPGSDQWTFVKVDGKWKISNFEFNKKQGQQP